MLTRSTHLFSILAAAGMTLGSTACVDIDGDEHVAPEVIDVVGQSLTDPTPRPIYMVHDAAEIQLLQEAEAVFGETPTPRPDPTAANFTLFMNRMGGTYTPGNNSASTNRSSILDTTRVINPWPVSDAGWQEVMSCVRSQFAPFNIDVTDVDPGTAPHIESVVAGTPGDLGLDPNVGGVSPFTSQCDVIQNSIVYTFAEVYGTNYRLVCEVVAQEVSHSFGLDHEFLCQDPMTYLTGCGAKTFQDTMASCGEDQARPCNCPWNQQNSVEMLRARVGVGDGDTVGPAVSITFPPDNSVVYPGFGVYVDASDQIALSRVELYIDGVQSGTDDAPPYQFNTPNDLTEGTHDISTVAIDTSENQTSTSITVNVSLDADPDQTPPPGGGGGGGSSNELVGGCSTSGSPASSAWLLLALIFVFRRRRRPDLRHR